MLSTKYRVTTTFYFVFLLSNQKCVNCTICGVLTFEHFLSQSSLPKPVRYALQPYFQIFIHSIAIKVYTNRVINAIEITLSCHVLTLVSSSRSLETYLYCPHFEFDIDRGVINCSAYSDDSSRVNI